MDKKNWTILHIPKPRVFYCLERWNKPSFIIPTGTVCLHIWNSCAHVFLDLLWSTHPLDGLKGNVSTSLVDEHQLPARVRHSDDLEDPKFQTQAKEKSGNKMPPALTRFLVMNECIKHSIWLVKIPPDERSALARKCNKTYIDPSKLTLWRDSPFHF